MHAINRRGFTLIELIIALALGALVGAAVLQAIVGTQRSSQAGLQRIDLQQNLRAGMGYITSVVRELNAADGDIGAATPTLLRFRGMRWASPLCSPPVVAGGASAFLLINSNAVYGLGTPDAASDSLLVYAEGDPGTRADDTWLVGEVASLGTATCTGGASALRLSARITAATGGIPALAGVTSGAPLRGFQWEELSVFQGAEGRWWIGRRTASRSGGWTAVEPLVGPITAAGLALQYYDSTGAVTATLANIASIAVTLRAESMSMVRTRPGDIDFARDSLLSRVALRNNPRF